MICIGLLDLTLKGVEKTYMKWLSESMRSIKRLLELIKEYAWLKLGIFMLKMHHYVHNKDKS